ncbi:MAG: glycine cleavage system protein GcvH [Spirochaetes bacterium]|nr:glycine cleavage system protein GcvH [Spirochaetota bacterium]
MKKFTKEHEWIEINDKIGVVGISDYAQHQLGDVVYVSLVKNIGDIVKKGEAVAEIESVKSVSQIYSPLDGKLTAFNTIFEDESQSGTINDDPYGEGWIFKIEISDIKQFDELLNESDYEKFIKTL